MDNVFSSAVTLLSQAEQRLEIAAQNIANATTPGYRRHIPFIDTLDAAALAPASDNGADAQSSRARTSPMGWRLDASPGKPIETGAPLDLSVAGDGYMLLRGPDGPLLARTGAFSRQSDGRLTIGSELSSQSAALQDVGGGDIIVQSSAVRVEADGVVVDGERPIGRVTLVTVDDPTRLVAHGGALAPPEDLALTPIEGRLRQGALESSNVSSATEMLEVMTSVRTAETGQRLMSVYDDLLGRAFDAFRQG